MRNLVFLSLATFILSPVLLLFIRGRQASRRSVIVRLIVGAEADAVNLATVSVNPPALPESAGEEEERRACPQQVAVVPGTRG